ncbi:hypothetical protein YYC_02564 [Plasmodium yoelii 17X]|nr:conserved Plasmodium protein, unknown function [Plasmodium yoelii]ETB60242.1 hypothetical protein YYC_02564 [Plasmodium yoelii 17X]CDU17604.1 conserved Plasmodium protein, unknown function [Plasmodium yoelii]VTZ77486.1 conserved Plasmodium protein, unknown function [Plasmodium yoelii]|eukprot:XP_022811976.1 conserved Plasmodium protein, unknown function [Plasmodium yoelii]
MATFCILYLFFLLISFNDNFFNKGKITHSPINVYYKNYSDHLTNNQRDKLMDILLHSPENETNFDMFNSIDIKKIEENEKGLDTLLKKQKELSNKIRNELKGYNKRSEKMSIKYNHDTKKINSDTEKNMEKEKNVFDVDTEIDVSANTLSEPIIVIKVPWINLYDQIEMEHEIGKLIDLDNEELFY